MPREYSRSKRVGDQIQKELALLIQREIKDPRIGMVTVTGVEVSKEYEKAKVYITNLGNSEDTRITVDALNQAAGFLRSQLGTRLTIRRIPQLIFEYDKSVEQGRYLSDLIGKAVGTGTDQDDKKET